MRITVVFPAPFGRENPGFRLFHREADIVNSAETRRIPWLNFRLRSSDLLYQLLISHDNSN